jgi:hypothetical protein
MLPGRLLALAGEQTEHKLTAKEQDTHCIFLRLGIQVSFRDCIF